MSNPAVPTVPPPGLDTPCLVADLEVVRDHVGSMQRALDDRGVALRPHTKTHKSIEVARMQLEAGARGITVGTLGEAETMAAGGIDDVFVAYPVWPSEPKARRLRALAESITIAIGLDSAGSARELGETSRGWARPIRVLVEVDSGERRTGVAASDVGELAGIALEAGLEVVGAFTHGGHSYAGPGEVGAAADDEVEALKIAREGLASAGVDDPVISAGSTPTALASARDVVTEERPGTYVFGDRQQMLLGSCGVPALSVAATVVRVAEDRLVLDSGAKSLSKDRPGWLEGHGWLPRYPDLEIRSLFDYHGVVAVPDGADAPALGEQVLVVPNHVCPVVNLFDRIAMVERGEVVGEWAVDARGRSG